MKKAVYFLFPALLLSGCAGYLGGTPAETDTSAFLSAMSVHEDFGGGAISSATANDVSPFIYDDGVNRYLIFASDRDGDYDLYWCREYHGEYTPPRQFGTNINEVANPGTNFNENHAMIVFDAETGSNALVVYQVETGVDFTNAGYLLMDLSLLWDEGASYYGILNEPAGLGLGSITIDGTNLAVVSDGSYESDLSFVYAPDGYHFINDLDMQYANFGDFCYQATGYQQENALAFIYKNTQGTFSLAFNYYGDVDGYTESLVHESESLSGVFGIENAENIDPYIDLEEDKLYFACDSAGTFDLYRYNVSLVTQTLTQDMLDFLEYTSTHPLVLSPAFIYPNLSYTNYSDSFSVTVTFSLSESTPPDYSVDLIVNGTTVLTEIDSPTYMNYFVNDVISGDFFEIVVVAYYTDPMTSERFVISETAENYLYSYAAP